MKKVSKKQLAVVLVVVVVATGSAIALHARIIHKAQHTSGTVPTSKKSPAATSSKNNKGAQEKVTSPSAPSAKAQRVPATGSGELVAPFGTFVSNHKPGQNGAPTTEQSVCNTTPGATCDIQFTNGSTTKNLGAQAADSNGSASWSWDINGSTFAPGSWKITAVVKLNGQPKTTTDPTPLEVK